MEGFYSDVYERIWGNFNIRGKITVNSSNNSLTISNSDNVSYSITIPEKEYNTDYVFSISEIVDVINQEFETSNIPVKALLGYIYQGDKLNSIVLEMTDGSSIASMSGTFFDAFFK